MFVNVRFIDLGNAPAGYHRGMSKALSRIGEASRTSSAKRWLIRNRIEFGATLAGIRRSGERPDWKEIARIVEAEGLRDSAGNPVSPDALRVMWSRIDATPANTYPADMVQVAIGGVRLDGYNEEATEAEPAQTPQPDTQSETQGKAKPVSWLDRLRAKSNKENV